MDESAQFFDTASMDIASGTIPAGYNQPIGTPQPSSLDTGGSDGGIFQTIGAGIQGISNIGLQWFTAATKGVSGPLHTPQPVQASPAAATANVINQLTGYLPIILLLIAAAIILPKIFGRR